MHLEWLLAWLSLAHRTFNNISILLSSKTKRIKRIQRFKTMGQVCFGISVSSTEFPWPWRMQCNIIWRNCSRRSAKDFSIFISFCLVPNYDRSLEFGDVKSCERRAEIRRLCSERSGIKSFRMDSDFRSKPPRIEYVIYLDRETSIEI